MGKSLNEVVFGFSLNNILNVVKGNTREIPDFYGPISKIDFANAIAIAALALKILQ